MVNLVGQVCNAQNIFVGLRGQTQHKIELDAAPASGKRSPAGVEQVLLRHILIDGIPQALGTGLRRKSQAALPSAALQLFHKIHGKIIRPQGGKGQVDLMGLTPLQ